MPEVNKKTADYKNEEIVLPLVVKGKISKKDIKIYTKEPWDMICLFFSQSVAFRAKDKTLMKKGFDFWFKYVVEKYGKSKWIELVIFCRPLKKNKK